MFPDSAVEQILWLFKWMLVKFVVSAYPENIFSSNLSKY